MAEAEPEDGPSCAGSDGVAFGDAYEVDTSTLKSDLHFLLDFSAGKLTYLWQVGGWQVPRIHHRRQYSVARGTCQRATKQRQFSRRPAGGSGWTEASRELPYRRTSHPSPQCPLWW